ncbi:MAG: FecR domain-containing protein [bacterium]|nr:FecR domain-containing protein [Candidatus Kapabacteria bacterium]
MTTIRLGLPLILFALTSIPSFANGQHDSLVFDGDASEVLFGNTCTVTVASLEGLAYGMTAAAEHDKTCGETRTEIVWKIRKLQVGDEVSVDAPMYTAKGGKLSVSLQDGSIVTLESLTKASLGGACKRTAGVGILLEYGKVEVNTQPAPPTAEPLGVQSDRVTAKPKGTVYSVDAGPEGGDAEHIVKVFSGSVEVLPSLKAVRGDVVDFAKEMAALNEQLSQGKITQQQFQTRLMSLQQGLSNKTARVEKSVVLNAGYTCAVNERGELSKPKKFKVD